MSKIKTKKKGKIAIGAYYQEWQQKINNE